MQLLASRFFYFLPNLEILIRKNDGSLQRIVKPIFLVSPFENTSFLLSFFQNKNSGRLYAKTFHFASLS
jgi:hypothetical protein